MDALVIGGHFSFDREDSLRHTDDYRLSSDGVPLSIPNMIEYFRNGRRFHDASKRLYIEKRRPYQQIYYSSLHLYNLLVKRGFGVGLINCHNPDDPARLKIFNEKPLVVVISSTFMNMDAVRKVAADVRKHLPDACIVAGGSFVRQSYLVWRRRDERHYCEREVLDRYFFTTKNPVTEIDYYIYDEHGEQTLVNLLSEVISGRRPSDMENTITFGEGGRLKVNSEKAEAFVFDSFAVDYASIQRRMLATVVPFSATYGCPFKCEFCNFSLSKPCRKSFETIFGELRSLATHNIVQKVWFTDDNFLLSPAKVEEFCLRYIKEDLPFSWMSFIRASSITPKTVELLKKSKCCLLILGLESGSPSILKNMGKKDNVDNYAKAMRLLVESGIDTEISFIFGYPGETRDTVSQTIDFINNIPASPSQVNYLYLFGFNLLPLAPVFEADRRKRWDVEGSFDNWRHNTMASDEVEGVLKRVASEAETTVFNYIDPEGKLPKSELVEIMRLRDEAARAVLKSAGDAELIMGRLESEVRRKFSF